MDGRIGSIPCSWLQCVFLSAATCTTVLPWRPMVMSLLSPSTTGLGCLVSRAKFENICFQIFVVQTKSLRSLRNPKDPKQNSNVQKKIVRFLSNSKSKRLLKRILFGGSLWGLLRGSLRVVEWYIFVWYLFNLIPICEGFLNVNSGAASGIPSNLGILDQIAALHWIQENIQVSFTIFNFVAVRIMIMSTRILEGTETRWPCWVTEQDQHAFTTSWLLMLFPTVSFLKCHKGEILLTLMISSLPWQDIGKTLSTVQFWRAVQIFNKTVVKSRN